MVFLIQLMNLFTIPLIFFYVRHRNNNCIDCYIIMIFHVIEKLNQVSIDYSEWQYCYFFL